MNSPLGTVLRTAVETDAAAFDRLRHEWDALLDGSAQQSYFLRPEWNRLWWKHHAPPGARLYLITCRNQHNELVGLAPLYWRQCRLVRLPMVRELLFLGMGIELKSSEYMDLIARRGEEARVAAAIAGHLRQCRDWDRILLWQVPRTSTVLPHYSRSIRTQSEYLDCDRAPYIDTTVGWHNYKTGLGRSMRRNVEYYARRLFRRYACEFTCVSEGAQLEQAMDALIRLHQARWQSQGEPGVFATAGVAEFIWDAARASLPQGQLRLWTLTIDGTIEAALVGFLDNGVLHYFQKGFNPAYAHEDIGTAMLALCIRDCFEDPAVRAFDFMGGGAAYKDRWTHLARDTVAYRTVRHNLRTSLETVWTVAVAALARVYRTLAPDSLRRARVHWLRARRLRQAAQLSRAPSSLPLHDPRKPSPLASD